MRTLVTHTAVAVVARAALPFTLLRLALVASAVTAAIGATAASSIEFAAASYSAAENAGPASITVQRTNDVHTVVSVDFATVDGTALAASDYGAVNGTLTFAAGVTHQNFTIPILNDGLIEGTESFQLVLSQPTGGAVLGSRATATVQLRDNDKPVELEFGAYWGREDEAAIVVGVVRGDEGEQLVTVDYATAPITATPGADFAEVAGTLTFAPGEKLKLIEIPLRNDALRETNESLRLILTNVVGSQLGVRKEATVRLVDNDPGVQFTTARYWIHEHEGALEVTVQRGSDVVLEAFTVDYTTQDGTARAGEDYVTTSGTLAFGSGELTRTFVVPILNDGVLEEDEEFKLTLRNPSAGVGLGSLSNLTATLCDSTGMAPHEFVAIRGGVDGVVTLAFQGGVSRRFRDFFDLYPIEVSEDLAEWLPLAVLVRTNNSIRELSFVDSGAVEAPARFYRIPTNHFITAYPPPTGPYAVGHVSRRVSDPTRRNRYGISANGSYGVTVWYPARRRVGQRPDRWIPDPIARDASNSGFWAAYGKASAWLDRLPYLCSHSFSNAPFASDLTRCPLILYSHGSTGQRTEAAPRAEDLASHGYVVVAPDHFDAFNTLWPDGFYHSSSTNKDTSDAGTRDRVRDLVFLLDEATKWNQSDAFFAGRLDLERVGVMGKSWGGETAAAFAHGDVRCQAAVLMDESGGSISGFSKASLTIASSGWGAGSVFNASRTNAVLLRLSDTDHASLSWYWMWSEYSIASNREAARTINAYALSFFNKFLHGRDDHRLDGPPNPKEFPRITEFRKK